MEGERGKAWLSRFSFSSVWHFPGVERILSFRRGRGAFERCKNKEQGNTEISPMVLHGVKIAMPRSLEGEAGW